MKVFQGAGFQELLAEARRRLPHGADAQAKSLAPAQFRDVFGGQGPRVRCNVKLALDRLRSKSLNRQQSVRARSRSLNDLTRNIVLWVVIAVVLLAVFSNFGQRAAAPDQLAVFPVPERGP